MMKKKKIIVFVTVMIMVLGLTACQGKLENAEERNAAGEIEAENVVAAEIPGESAAETNQHQTEGTAAAQESSNLLDAIIKSPEALASSEYDIFCEGYDTDGEVLAQAGNEPIEEGYAYEAYFCYSKEMEEKIDEICAKYGLAKLSGFQLNEDYEDLCAKAGVGSFCKESSEDVNHSFLSGYVYADGLLKLEGSVVLARSSIYEATYQFMRYTKGFFNDSMNLGDLAEYSVREYTTEDGVSVFLATAAERKPLILAEREKSFVEVIVLDDLMETTDVTDEMLEELADSFDFTAIP